MKKAVFLLTLIILFAVAAFAQNTTADEAMPKVEIIGMHWFQRISMRQEKSLTAYEIKNGLPSSGVDAMTLDWKSSKYFVYEVGVKNETGRKITGLAYDYVFSDLENKNVIERRKFMYIRRLKNNKKLIMQSLSDSPPTNLVRAEDLEKNARSLYHESVEIRCIVFDDRMTWKKKDVPETDCEELRLNIKRREDAIKRL